MMTAACVLMVIVILQSDTDVHVQSQAQIDPYQDMKQQLQAAPVDGQLLLLHRLLTQTYLLDAWQFSGLDYKDDLINIKFVPTLILSNTLPPLDELYHLKHDTQGVINLNGYEATVSFPVALKHRHSDPFIYPARGRFDYIVTSLADFALFGKVAEVERGDYVELATSIQLTDVSHDTLFSYCRSTQQRTHSHEGCHYFQQQSVQHKRRIQHHYFWIMNKTRLQQIALGVVVLLIIVMSYQIFFSDDEPVSLSDTMAETGLALPTQLDEQTLTKAMEDGNTDATPARQPSLQPSDAPIKVPLTAQGQDDVTQYLTLLKEHKLESLKAQIAQSKASQAEAAKVVKEVKEKNQAEQNQLVFNPMPLPETPSIEAPIISEEPDIALIKKATYDFKLIYLRVMNNDIKGFLSINDKLYEAWSGRRINEDITIDEINSQGLLLTVRGQAYSLRPGFHHHQSTRNAPTTPIGAGTTGGYSG